MNTACQPLLPALAPTYSCEWSAPWPLAELIEITLPCSATAMTASRILRA
jgi:hypothetical protein